MKRGDLSLEEAEQRARRLPRPAADRARRDPPVRARRPRSIAKPPPAGAGRAAPRRDRRGRERARRDLRARCRRSPRASTSTRSCSSSSRPATRCGPTARSTGRWPRPWPTARCSLEGTDLRIAGQDTRRGTFSHRHAVLDRPHQRRRVRAAGPPRAPTRRKFWIYDSLLSEYAGARLRVRLLGGGQGLAGGVGGAVRRLLERRSTIVDQFLVAAEDKWNQTSGLVLLLPHGYEGQGPEHSSARVERFLTLCAEDNIQVANCTAGVAVLPPAAPPGAARRCASRS